MVETLISSVLFAFVIAGVYSVYTAMQGTLTRGEMKADLQQNARIGLGRMVSEIRMAGSDPSGVLSSALPPPRAAIRAAAAGCLSFIAPDELGNTKQITYSLDGPNLRRREQPWNSSESTFTGGSVQPVAEAMHQLLFTYYDQHNKVIAPAAWSSTHACPPDKNATTIASVTQLTYWQMQQIRRITIALRTWKDPQVPGLAPEFFTLTTDVRLRNR